MNFFATRKIEIKETATEAVVTTSCNLPLIAIPGFVLTWIMWAAATLFFGAGVLGFIDPQTMTTPIRVLLIIWLVGWIAIGFWRGPVAFRGTFGQFIFRASPSGFRVERSSFLGVSHKDYAWNQVEAFTENTTTDNILDRDLLMMVAGRTILLDSGLPKAGAKQALEIWSRWLDRNHRMSQAR